MPILDHQSLSLSDQDLLARAESVMSRAYQPYSRFSVGAAILGYSGAIHVGSNIENATYDLTIHAEASAISSANITGERIFRTIAVIGGSDRGPSLEPVTPCGICRQLIHEFAQVGGADIRLICSNTAKDRILVTSIQEIFPHAFGPKDLGIDLSRYR